MQFKVRVDSYTNHFLPQNTQKTCFSMDYCICVIYSQGWNLYKANFPPRSTQKDVFSCGIPYFCNLKSELTFAQIGFCTANTRKDVFCRNILHLCNLKSELTFVKIVFPILKYSKRRVLRWIIAFVQFKVRVGNCTKLIFHSKTHKMACFEVEYHICVISSQSWHVHKPDFFSQNTQNEVLCCGIFHLRNLESELTVAQTGFSTVKR